ncbi:hypothetical protein E5163_09450 [Marinicauda algicola]|uniref:EF-hand domain-containing protein n=1 Tax=Marinicauda algicola TaxID=2029849 RepID=A0A4S2H1B0_9PROT|nr:hypothetical protein [Marinicauda algicola]TGY89330.1 hypothetical protein E5163_09450 [Marinicauda algicola]
MLKITLAAALVLAAPAAALAQSSAPTLGDGAANKDAFMAIAEARFAYIDADSSLAIDEAEYVSVRLQEFDLADRNGDGELTRGEVRQFPEPVSGVSLHRSEFEEGVRIRFNQLAEDGTISQSAYLGAASAAFDAADRNGDGAVDRGEARNLAPL